MVEKTIKINVDTGDSGAELKNLEKGFKKVDAAAEKTNKSVDDVASNGGAIAILDSLTGGLATRLKDAYEATKLFNVSLKGTKTALIATGIGALVIALGLVVAYWDDIVDYISGANEKLEAQHDLLTSNISLLDAELKFLKTEAGYNKDRGISNAANLKAQKDILTEKKKLIAEDIKILQAQLLKEQSVSREAGLWELILSRGQATRSKVTEEEQKRINDIEAQILALQGTALETDDIIDNLGKPKPESPSGGKQQREKAVSVNALETPEDKRKRELDEQIASDVAKAQQESVAAVGRLDFQKSMSELEIEEAKRLADEKLTIEEALAKQKEAVLDAQVNNIGSAFALIGQLGEKNKALQAIAIIGENATGIAKQVISTNAANLGALATPQAIASSGASAIPVITANNISLGIGVAASALATGKALAALGKGGSTGGASASGGRGASAPAFNLVQGTGTNQIAESLQSGQDPIKAYVVSADVTSGQSLDRNIEANASI